MDLKSTYNRIARDWNKDHKNDTWWKSGALKFISFLQPGSVLLDVGCAGGLKSEFFSNQGFKVVGIDFSDEMIKIAEERLLNNRFFVRDIREPLDLDCDFNGYLHRQFLFIFLKMK